MQALMLAVTVGGCRPVFEGTGTLVVGGVPFNPTACHVLTTGGIELLDVAGRRLVLTIPAQVLDAWKEIRVTPRVAWQPGPGAAVDLGACSSLLLRGEGYHGEGRRAASGQVTLTCPGETAAGGELRFSGCF